MMPMRKQQNDNDSSTADDNRDGDSSKSLPVLKGRSTSLVETPKEGAKVVIDRGADVYFAACRRIAGFLNRDD